MLAWQIMVVLWKHVCRGKTYEVRSAGASLRLYTNGAFHSQYHPGRYLPGGVWDLLGLPGLLLDKPAPNVLILGVGGGAVVHLLDRMIAPARIVGVDIDPVHLRVALDHFQCRQAAVKLVCADARQWVRRSRRRFDLIVDDLYIDSDHDPQRPEGLDQAWHSLLARRLTDRGALVQNHLSAKLAKHSIAANEAWYRAQFKSAVLLQRPHYENGIVALHRDPVGPGYRRSLFTALRQRNQAAADQLSLRVRQLF